MSSDYQLAKAECANHQSNGSCLNIYFADNGQLVPHGRLDKCKLRDTDATECAYFVECVLPSKKTRL
jgi:hypothetical protein